MAFVDRLNMANDDDFNMDKASRSAQDGDAVSFMRKPLGLVLNSDDEGNACRRNLPPKRNAVVPGQPYL
jgi:hypothetical protein